MIEIPAQTRRSALIACCGAALSKRTLEFMALCFWRANESCREGAVEHLYIADTNLFFECKHLEDLPWGELGADPIVARNVQLAPCAVVQADVTHERIAIEAEAELEGRLQRRA